MYERDGESRNHWLVHKSNAQGHRAIATMFYKFQEHRKSNDEFLTCISITLHIQTIMNALGPTVHYYKALLTSIDVFLSSSSALSSFFHRCIILRSGGIAHCSPSLEKLVRMSSRSAASYSGIIVHMSEYHRVWPLKYCSSHGLWWKITAELALKTHCWCRFRHFDRSVWRWGVLKCSSFCCSTPPPTF